MAHNGGVHRHRPDGGKPVARAGAIGLLEKVELMRAIAGVRGVTQHEQRVLLAIASLINDRRDNCAFPPQAQLAAMLGIDTRHVARAISGLKAKGLVTVAKAGNSRHANHYQVNVAAVLGKFGASTGASAPHLEALLPRLYGQISAACRGVASNACRGG